VAHQESYADRFNLDRSTTIPTYFAGPVPTQTPPPGWFPDPAGRFDHRWWDGAHWTETVSRDESVTTDPL
jgi:hypothetical protein